MIRDGIAKVAGFADLSPLEAAGIMAEIISGRATDSQIGSFITAMSMKTESVEEIASFARVIRASAKTINPKVQGMLVDTCGTGGDGSGTFNISTAAAFVTAGAGIPVVKHGNRSVSSRCGSADVLEELGVDINVPPERIEGIIEDIGIGFLFAQNHHPALKNAARARGEVGIKSVFNILGPLSNPAGAAAQLLGVYDPSLTEKIAEVLALLGTETALVVHGDGIDEITTTGKTVISELSGGHVMTYVTDCTEFGIRRAELRDLKGGDAHVNAGIISTVLEGAEGSQRDIVLVNAAAAIYAGGGAASIDKGLSAAEKSVDSGRALEKLELLVRATGGAT